MHNLFNQLININILKLKSWLIKKIKKFYNLFSIYNKFIINELSYNFIQF